MARSRCDSAQAWPRPRRRRCRSAARGFLDHFLDLGRLARLYLFGVLDVGVQLDPADARRQALGQRAQAGGDVAQPVVQVVGAGIELRVGLVRVGQASQVAVQRLDAFLVLRLGRRQRPALVVEVETRLGASQVGVLGGLRLRTGEILAQRPADVAHLDQHAILPAGHVVHPDARREDVVGDVAARLGQQGIDYFLEGLHRGVAGDHLPPGALGGGLGVLLHGEQVGFLAPVPADQHRHQQVDAQQASHHAHQPGAAEVGTHIIHGIVHAIAHGPTTLLPVQHGKGP